MQHSGASSVSKDGETGGTFDRTQQFEREEEEGLLVRLESA